MKNLFPQICSLLVKQALLLTLRLAFTSLAGSQSTGSLRGQVLDPSGAVVPGAFVILTQGTAVLSVQSGNDGVYIDPRFHAALSMQGGVGVDQQISKKLMVIVNLGTPNGTLGSPLFGKTQSLASGPFGSPTPGNRSVFLQAIFTF
jgi:hypothetical protein